MVEWLLVGMGGFFGAILRYLVSGLVQDWSGSISFPYGTLAVNIIGCLVIGFLMHLADVRGMVTPSMRLFIVFGFLGSLTTFSTFGGETVGLVQQGRVNLALLNVGASVVFCLCAVWLGRVAAGLIWR